MKFNIVRKVLGLFGIRKRLSGRWERVGTVTPFPEWTAHYMNPIMEKQVIRTVGSLSSNSERFESNIPVTRQLVTVSGIPPERSTFNSMQYALERINAASREVWYGRV